MSATSAPRLCTEATVKKSGFNVWASGEHDDKGPEVDIVAVQGLGADPYNTWVWKHDPTEVKPKKRHRLNCLPFHRKKAQIDRSPVGAPTASDTLECMWLRDLLPDLIPSARIATYSYPSDWRNADIKTSLRKCGEQLLNVLLQNRSTEKETRRPLLFIGHSLGGLVIKQALVVAVHGEHYRDIRLSTAGICFLGTPHQGSRAAGYGLWFAQMKGLETRLLESLIRNSDDLHHIARDFEASYADVDIICYYEDKDKAYGPLRTKFVDHQSASLIGKRALYLTTDHSGLNKFRSLEDENFLLVQPEIQRLVRTAPQRIVDRYQLHVEKETFRVDFSLKGIPVVENFVGRNEETTRITQTLLPTSTDPMRRKIFVIHGLGGIGKTQLSVEFTRTYQTGFSAALWVDGSSKERLRRSIADLAERLPQHQLLEGSRIYSQKGSTDVDEVVKDVLRWLSQSSNDQWLLIFDNIDREYSVPSGDPEAFDVKDYFPKADQGSILITSRLASLSQLGMGMKLEPVDGVQGTSILENSLERSAEGSLELVKLLQGLPLAINQAGSYMRMTNTNVSKYIEMYNQAWAKLMEKQYGYTLADRSMLTTWTLSYNSLRSKSEQAANLLMLWAFLDNQDLWYELLTPAREKKFVDQLPPWFADCVRDEFEFKECIGLLRKYSFIDVKTESSFSMHPVLHHWCSHTFEQDNATMGWLAIIVVASAVPDKTELHYTLVQRRLLPHCDHVYSMLQENSWDGEDQLFVGSACYWLGSLYDDQSKIKEAEDMYLRALIAREKCLGPGHTSTLNTVNSLGVSYMHQGKMKEAEDMYLRALVGYEKIYGSEHSKMLDVTNNLGILYKYQGKEKEAEEMYLRALVGYEKVCGPEHSETLIVIYNLGILYKDQGMEKEAEDMYLRALAGREKALGPEHRDTLETTYILGNLYLNQGRMKEAEDMYLRALAGREKTLGPEHRDTLKTTHNLGILYFNQGRMDEAEDMYLRALAGREKILGPEHSETLHVINNLGNLYKVQGKEKEAEDIYLRALAGREKLFGPEHRDTLDTMYNLGNLYFDQGRMEEAEDMYLRVLIGREKVLGPERKETLDTRYNLGNVCAKTSRFAEAVQHYELAAQGYTTILGPEHEETIDALEKLNSVKSKLREGSGATVDTSAPASSSA